MDLWGRCGGYAILAGTVCPHIYVRVERGGDREAHLAVELANGVRMSCIEQGDRVATTVLLVHAVGDSGRAFEALLVHLPDSVHAVAPTLRGHGSASRPESGYRSADLAGDLAALMDALHVEAGVAVGASSGGRVALRLALDHPARVDSGRVAPLMPHEAPAVAAFENAPARPARTARFTLRPRLVAKV
jgi:pimeloyl-ACP methyl ester carboxylesterase